MTRKLLPFMILGIIINCCTIYGQVGIGTTSPDNSSILHLNSAKKGLLLTNIALTSATDNTTIPSPAKGLLIWNNGNGGFGPEGLYYWNNSQWNQLSPAAASSGGSTASSWNNSGTTAGNNQGANTGLSIGTSTYDDLYFKVNSVKVGHLGTDNSLNFGKDSSASQNAVAFGQNAKAQTNESIAVGTNALASGYQAMAMGYNAKATNNNDTSFGNNAQSSGQNSVAVGASSTASGQNSTALGSGTSAGGQNSTVIGYGATTNQANAIILGNNTANIGIGTSTPNNTAKIDINGQYKLGEKGNVHKNMISFDIHQNMSIVNLGAGQTTAVNFVVPAASAPTTTRATVTVTPDGDFLGTTFILTNARLNGTNTITVNLTNTSANPASLYYGHFYLSISEF